MELDAYNEYKESFIATLMKLGLSREAAIRAFDEYEEQEELEYQMMKEGLSNNSMN